MKRKVFVALVEGWLTENCGRKVDAWRGECDVLERYMLKDGFYQPLSLQEREEIVKAFGFCEYLVAWAGARRAATHKLFPPSSPRAFLQLRERTYVRHHRG